MHKLKSAAGAAAVVALGLGGALVVPTTASAVVPAPSSIQFTAETPGAKPNGYFSAEAPGVRFFDTVGSTLQVNDFGVQSHGQALGVVAGGNNTLEIRLSGPTNVISMAFGNDDPSLSDTTDQAVLTLFRGATQVGRVDVNFNANDVMDQTIGYSGGALFNRATLAYVTAGGTPKPIAEIVDDIKVNPICTVAGGPAGDNLTGTPGNDVICGDLGNDQIRGLGGDDLIVPGPGRDIVKAGAGNDVVLDNRGDDSVSGGSGSDDLRTGVGKDIVTGGSGNDTITTGAGKDKLAGGSGSDVLKAGSAKDRCNGGAGHDLSSGCEVKKRIP